MGLKKKRERGWVFGFETILARVFECQKVER